MVFWEENNNNLLPSTHQNLSSTKEDGKLENKDQILVGKWGLWGPSSILDSKLKPLRMTGEWPLNPCCYTKLQSENHFWHQVMHRIPFLSYEQTWLTINNGSFKRQLYNYKAKIKTETQIILAQKRLLKSHTKAKKRAVANKTEFRLKNFF